MNTSGVTSAPSIFIHDQRDMNGPRPPSSRMAGKLFSRSQGPMAVPNARPNESFAPPPLPPPRYIEDLAAGSDPGWKWGHTPKHEGFGGSFAFSGSSSSSARGSWDQRMEDEGFPDRPDYSRRGSSSTTIRSPPSSDRAYDLSRNIDEGYHSLSGSSLVNHRSVNVFLTYTSLLVRFPHHASQVEEALEDQSTCYPLPERLVCSHKLNIRYQCVCC